jgi:coenzyme F420 biosynthesis associated uncharacterized protein
VGRRLARPGPPDTTREEAAGLVAELRHAARRALFYVSDITGLTEAAAQASTFPVYVVDRRGFVTANTQLAAALELDLGEDETGWWGRQAGAAELGALLAALSARVLGQFDPFTPGGRLLLVAPNVLRFERELNVPSADFRLWVALHEQTHAVQFAAAPWLPGFLKARLGEVTAAVTAADAAGTDGEGGLMALLRQVPRALADDAPSSPLTALLPAAAREPMARLTAAMSLLEGHADVVMDAVGPRVVKGVDHIRGKFDARRVAHGRLERAARRLAGLEAKNAQYLEGAQFVRGVLAEVGHEGLAKAFASPDNLPLPGELDDPPAWVRRVAR